jgi:hypothetical protein
METNSQAVNETFNINDAGTVLGGFFKNDEEEPASSNNEDQSDDDIHDDNEKKPEDDHDDDNDHEEDFDELGLEDNEDTDETLKQVFKVGDQEVTLKELQEGYVRQADYQKKAEIVEHERKTIENDRKIYAEASQQTQAIYQAMVDYVQQNLIHPMPDGSLAQTNPRAYNEELALHYRTVQEAQQIFNAAAIAKQTIGNQVNQMSEMQYQRHRENEFAKLQNMYPSLKDPSKLQRFEQSVTEFAKEIGFSDQDIQSQTTDHRVLRVLHLAKIGQKTLAERKDSKQKIGEKVFQKSTNRMNIKEYANNNKNQAFKNFNATGSIQAAGDILNEIFKK